MGFGPTLFVEGAADMMYVCFAGTIQHVDRFKYLGSTV